jgi:putative flippase GtrA
MPWLYNISVQFIKFALVGVLNTIVGYGIYYLLLYFKFHYLAALLISFLFGVLNSYFWNKYWVFLSSHHFNKELPRFVIVYVVTLVINASLLPVFVELLKMDPRIAQLFFLFFLPIITFIGLKYWGFR